MAVFTDPECAYLGFQTLGRLATIGPNGPQNHPVWYRVNAGTGTIDIGGTDLSATQKYRNVCADPRVSFVVDDTVSEPVVPGGDHGRGVEVRGCVEIVHDVPLIDGFSTEVLRITPRRILGWNLDGPGYQIRNVRPEVTSGAADQSASRGC